MELKVKHLSSWEVACLWYELRTLIQELQYLAAIQDDKNFQTVLERIIDLKNLYLAHTKLTIYHVHKCITIRWLYNINGEFNDISY